MGIRESLEKPDQNSKLKDFTMPEDEPKQELEFDFEKELKPEDIRILKDHAKMIHLSENAPIAAEALILLYQFQPEETKTIFHTNENYEFLKNAVKEAHGSHRMQFALAIKFIFPEKINELAQLLEFNQIQKDLDEIIKEESGLDFISENAINALMLFPDKKDELNLDQVEKTVDTFLQNFNESLFKEYKTLLFIKIFFPEKFSKIKIDDKKWQEFKTSIKNYRNLLRKDINISDTIFYLTLLAAPEIDFSKSGLKAMIQEQKTYQKQTLPRPERRQF